MYTLKNFAWGELSSSISSSSTQMVLVSGNTLPTTGTFIAVIWNMDVYPNPVDDPHTEIVEAVYSGVGYTFNIVRAQEGTVAVEHASGSQVALHVTAGVIEAERLTLGSATGLVLSNNSLSVDVGYSIPTDVLISSWNTAYGWGNHADAGYLTSVSGQDHNILSGLTSDSHTQYAMLSGRSGGQSLYGSSDASGAITIAGTSNATAGATYLEPDDDGTVCIGLSSMASLVSPYSLVIQGPASTLTNMPGWSIYNVGSTYPTAGFRCYSHGNSQFEWNLYYGGSPASTRGSHTGECWRIFASDTLFRIVANYCASPGATVGTSRSLFSHTSGVTEINEYGLDIDLKVRSDNDEYCLFLDGGTDSVGIGTGSIGSNQKLHVYTNGWKYGTQMRLECGDAKQATLNFVTPSGSAAIGAAGTSNQYLYGIAAGDMFIANRAGGAIRISADTSYYANQGLNLLENGRLGIKVLAPNAVLDVNGDCRFGDSSTNYTGISSTGDVSFSGTAGFYPVRLAQSTQPTPGTGELVVWRDTDDGKVYLVYNDADSGVKQVEMV